MRHTLGGKNAGCGETEDPKENGQKDLNRDFTKEIQKKKWQIN